MVFVAVGCAAVVVASTQFASALESKGEQPRPTLKPADADGNGKITRVEWMKFVQAFRRFDADNDNHVDVAELKAADTIDDAPIVLAPIDFDGDGRVTRTEWTSLAAAFKRIDTDGNNALDLAEFEAIVDARRAAAQFTEKRALRAGLWRGAIVEGRGDNSNSGTPIELMITGNKIAGRDPSKKTDGPNLGIGKFVTSGRPDAGFLDARYLDGTNRICLGIFRMDGETLHWCVSNRTGQRPDEFRTANGFWLMILKRVPDEKR